jgi:eukaryotic translation initiation factor 2C
MSSQDRGGRRRSREHVFHGRDSRGRSDRGRGDHSRGGPVRGDQGHGRGFQSDGNQRGNYQNVDHQGGGPRGGRGTAFSQEARGSPSAGRGSPSRGRGSSATGRDFGVHRSILPLGLFNHSRLNDARPLNNTVPPPSPEVTTAEDAIQRNKLSGQDLGVSGLQLAENGPFRPGYGTKGQSVVLWANYFELGTGRELQLHCYSIQVQPEATGKKLKQIINLTLTQPGFYESRDQIVTDFKSLLVACTSLNLGDSMVRYQAEDEAEPRPNAQVYTVSVQANAAHNVSDLVTHLQSTTVNTTYTDKDRLLQALNILLGHYAKASAAIATIGASKSFNFLRPSNLSSTSLGGGLFALRGFFSSVRVAACRVLININVSHGAFYDAVPLDQLMQRHSSGNMGLARLESFLKGLQVRVTHLDNGGAASSRTRIRTIKGLAHVEDGRGQEDPPAVERFGAGPQDVHFFRRSTPAGHNGRYMSVYDHFRQSMPFIRSF